MLRINIPLTTDEMRLLICNAERQCRAPKDQARFILRSVLMNEPSAEIKSQPVVNVSLGQNKSAEQTVTGSGAFVGAN